MIVHTQEKIIDYLCYECQVHYSQLQPLNQTIWLNNLDCNLEIVFAKQGLNLL
jgi:hypothetical protein